MDVDIDMKAYGTKVTSKDFGLIWMKKVRNYSLFETKINPYTHIYLCNSNTIHIKSFVKIIFLIASRPGGLKSSDIAEVGRGGGGSLWSDFLSSVTCKLCLGNTGFGR